MRPTRTFLLLMIMLLLPAIGARADAPPPSTDTSVQAGSVTPRLDVEAETKAYLAKVPADKMARSDAYFEGGYWLQLWDFLAGALVLWLALGLGWSASMRDRAERL